MSRLKFSRPLALGFFIASTLALTCHQARAATGFLSESIPDFFSRSDATILYRGLGHACSAMTSVTHVLPCNPAFADINGGYDVGDRDSGGQERTDKLFAAHLFFGNDSSTLREIEQLINGPHSRRFVEDLFSKSQVIEMEASGEFSFRTRWFGASFTPYRLTYFSAISDPSYPLIALHAMSERTIRIMGGGEIERSGFGQTMAGVQLRGVEREFVQSEFTLFDAITSPEGVLQKKTQKALFLEPGIAHVFNGFWQPRATAFLSGTGWTDSDYEEIDRNPVFDFGAGVKPPLEFGVLDLAVNYRAKRSQPEVVKSLRGAVSYSLGMLEGIAAVGYREWSAGLLTGFWSARVGIVYASSLVVKPGGQEESVQSTFTEFSLVF